MHKAIYVRCYFLAKQTQKNLIHKTMHLYSRPITIRRPCGQSQKRRVMPYPVALKTIKLISRNDSVFVSYTVRSFMVVKSQAITLANLLSLWKINPTHRHILDILHRLISVKGKDKRCRRLLCLRHHHQHEIYSVGPIICSHS